MSSEYRNYGGLSRFGEIIDFKDFERGLVPSLIELRKFYDSQVGRRVVLRDKGFTELINTFIRPTALKEGIPLAKDSRPPISVEIIHSPDKIFFDVGSGLFKIAGGKKIETEIPREGLQIPNSRGELYCKETGFPLAIEKNWDITNARSLLATFYRTNWQIYNELAYVWKGHGRKMFLTRTENPVELAERELSFFWTMNENLPNPNEPLFNIVKRRFGFLNYGPWHIDSYWSLTTNSGGDIDGDIGYRLRIA